MSFRGETPNWLRDTGIEREGERLSVWKCNGYVLGVDGKVVECPLTIEAGAYFEALQAYRGHASDVVHVNPQTGEEIPSSHTNVGLGPK